MIFYIKFYPLWFIPKLFFYIISWLYLSFLTGQNKLQPWWRTKGKTVGQGAWLPSLSWASLICLQVVSHSHGLLPLVLFTIPLAEAGIAHQLAILQGSFLTWVPVCLTSPTLCCCPGPHLLFSVISLFFHLYSGSDTFLDSGLSPYNPFFTLQSD